MSDRKSSTSWERMAAVLVLVLAAPAAIANAQWSTPAPRTSSRANNESQGAGEIARLMLADAQQWARRGWKDAAIKLARRAAAMDVQWGAEELTPSQLLQQLTAGEDQYSTQTPTPTTFETTPRIATSAPVDHHVRAASFSAVPPTAHAGFEEPTPQGPAAQLSEVAPRPPTTSSEIRLVLENGFQPPTPPAVSPCEPVVSESAPAAATTSAPTSDWFGDSGAPSWRTLSLMLFVALTLMLLRDIRLPGQLQIQLTNPKRQDGNDSHPTELSSAEQERAASLAAAEDSPSTSGRTVAPSRLPRASGEAGTAAPPTKLFVSTEGGDNSQRTRESLQAKFGASKSAEAQSLKRADRPTS